MVKNVSESPCPADTSKRRQAMAPSTRRLATTPSRRSASMQNLEELGELFLAHHEALGRSAATVTHYQDSLKLLVRCFKELDILPLSTNLTSHHMNLFATWLRETPTKLWRGKTERSIYGVHGALKDTKAFV